MTPSIPVSEPEGVWPDKKTPHITRNIKTVETIGSFTVKIYRRGLDGQSLWVNTLRNSNVEARTNSKAKLQSLCNELVCPRIDSLQRR